jgi:hypothetical protein
VNAVRQVAIRLTNRSRFAPVIPREAGIMGTARRSAGMDRTSRRPARSRAIAARTSRGL